ncbi:E3 SUMO-protein ligase ZBED1-like [Misgurnus anguillicaudatus]|uniref:E3 SUMO-protein ligase ZBED1-like n=1 Tax=Misgurnus anguillicaudatus TaxID=75329 RepID=UPI003CCF35AA
MAGTAGEREQLLPKKTSSTSVVWSWFGFTASDEEQTTPRCKLCLKAVVVAGSSTTNLFQHLKRRHAAEWEKCCLLRKKNHSSGVSASTPFAKQTTLPQSFSNSLPYEKSGARWKAITEAITLYIAMDMLPVYSVEKRGFNNMLKVLDARYTVPSRKYFSDVALPQLYNNTRQKIISELKGIDFYAATTDLWSSRTMQPYMCLTVHYVSESWDMRSVCLQTSYFPQDHTGQTIALELKDALNSWGLSEERLTRMTTDSDSKVSRAMKDNNWPNLKCLGHRLHNAVVNGVKDERIDRAIGVCKKAVSAFSYSWKKRRDMAEVQAELGLPPHQLVTESLTRWGSRQKMIERFLEQERAIVRVLGADMKTRHLVPMWQDLEVLDATNKAVKPLQDFVDALSGESYKYSDPENDELLDMASLMDPRFRTNYITPDKLDIIKKRAVTELSALCSEEEGPAVQMCQEEQSPPPKKKTLAAFFKKAAPASLSHQTVKEKVEAELTTYLLGPEVDPDTDQLEWWKQHQPNFTRLSRLARKYLAIPATSAPSERVFSVGGGIVTCNRACLKPAVVDRLIFLAKNV